MKTLALIALGSNLGNSVEIIHKAIERLQSLSDEPVLKSSCLRTAPVDCPPGSPDFVNAAVALVPKPGESPESLLSKLQELERAFGRQPKTVLNEPRPLDLDLIAFGSETRKSEKLILPHPRAHQRQFVLQPLSEIVPDYIFPNQNQSVKDLLAAIKTQETT